jgi:antirestriction protein ArdC
MAGSTNASKTRELIKDMIIASLKENKIPWHKPWQGGESMPANGITKRKYHGVNAFYLSLVCQVNGWTDNRFCTFKQIKENGWHLVAGSKGLPIEFWFVQNKAKEGAGDTETTPENSDEGTFKRMYVKNYYVFNASQIEGIPPLEKGDTVVHDEIMLNKAVGNIINFGGFKVNFFGMIACFRPGLNEVEMPLRETFTSQTAYDTTLLHELSHATSIPLKRDVLNFFGTPDYAVEELRAEIASWFMATELGCAYDSNHIDQHKAYIQSWSEKIQKDQKILFKAITDAEKIRDYLFEVGKVEELLAGIEQPVPMIVEELERERF